MSLEAMDGDQSNSKEGRGVWRDDSLARVQMAEIERRATQRRQIHGDALPPERPLGSAPLDILGSRVLVAHLRAGMIGALGSVLPRFRRDPKRDLIRAMPLFQGSDASTVAEIASLSDEVDVARGTVLIQEGTSAHEFFVVVEGSLRVERAGHVLATVGPGEFVGEIALIDHGPRTATVTAREPSRLLVFGRREFNRLLSDNPAIELPILQALARRVRHLDVDIAC